MKNGGKNKQCCIYNFGQCKYRCILYSEIKCYNIYSRNVISNPISLLVSFSFQKHVVKMV